MKFLVKIGLVLGAGATALYAAPGSPAFDDDGASAAVTVSAGAKLSIAEMVVRMSAAADQVLIDVRHVSHLQQVARKQKDVIKLNCVNDKLVQLKPIVNIFDHAKANIGGVGPEDAQRTSFDEASKAADDVRKLREEADQCAGEPALSSESDNDVTHPPIPDNPFTNPFNDLDAITEPPGYASPYS